MQIVRLHAGRFASLAQPRLRLGALVASALAEAPYFDEALCILLAD
jgi:hypothetical protein